MTHMPDNHERIATNLNVQPLLAALESLPELWDQITVRQDYPGSAHHDTQAIFLRGPRVFTFEDYMLSTVAFDYPAMEDLKTVLLPLMRPILHELDVSELGFVIIARLKAGGHIDAHVDEGTYADHYSRFHTERPAWCDPDRGRAGTALRSRRVLVVQPQGRALCGQRE
jgi:hypothetical protein